MLVRTGMFARPKKSLGQNFLVNEKVVEAEAVHGEGKNVLEMGPGYGILTKALCMSAKRVVAVEKDQNLFKHLKNEIKSRRLTLINADFFEVSDEELMLGDTDILISNIPYALSSKTIEWLSEKGMQAVLCLQKEFVEHMLAREDDRKYSKLSVITALSFSVTKIIDVPRGNFRPMPRVDSALIYMKPRGIRIAAPELAVISALMQHKKKTVRSSLIDSHSHLKKSKEQLSAIADSLKQKDERLFKMSPQEILSLAKEISARL